MATYGKKKKGLLSSFSVFQDEKPEQSPNIQRPAYSHIGKAKSIMQRSRSRNKADESSGDELAETALRYNVPSLPNKQPIRLPSLHSLGAIATEDIIRPQTSKSDSITLDKPLPPIPPKDPFAPFVEQRRHWKNRPALGKKTTNMKVTDSPSERSIKHTISHPIPMAEPINAAFPSTSRPATSPTIQTTFNTQTTTTKAEELSTKISKLMQQAAVQEEQSRQKTAIYEAESAKLSPLERSRKAIIKATRAIRGKLSSSSTSTTSDASLNARRRRFTRPSLSSDFERLPQYKSQEEFQERLHRRISEGRNLSNPKVQALTDNGHIARKPLPVYESMKSRSLRSRSAEDPFSDDTEPERRLSTQDYSGFDFEFSKDKYKGRARENLPASDQSDASVSIPYRQCSVSRSVPKFSNTISGLAQHPDTMVFSSPPFATSTPEKELQPTSSANANEPSKDALVRRQSGLDSGFEAHSEESPPEKNSHRATASDGSMLSVKRKGGSHDLRFSVESATKKAKTASVTSQESVTLANGISQLSTGDERAPLSPKSTNTRVKRFNPEEGKKRRELSIFDVVKGTGLGVKDERAEKNTQTRPRVTKHSSFSRPSSTLFSRGRESRAGMRRLHSYGGDDMDVDELQNEDLAYQVGGKKM